MPKAVLRYDLDDPQDREAFERANKSLDMALCLWDIEQEVFRKHRKYNPENFSEEQLAAIEFVIDQYYAILKDRDIDVNNLIS